MIISIAASLQKYSVNYELTVNRVLKSYADKEVIKELQNLAGQKPGLLQKLFLVIPKRAWDLRTKRSGRI